MNEAPTMERHDATRGSLRRALAYTNPAVPYKFVESFDVSLAEAGALFTELKKWLWLCARPDAPALSITAELMILDEMWHTFLLFTRDYHAYCMDCFGRFLHHRPATADDQARLSAERQRDPAGARARRRDALARQHAFIYDQLGPETLLTWYADYPRRYDRGFFARAMRLPPAPDLGADVQELLAALTDAPTAIAS